MARNGAGTYSLPAGNPVVTGTVISSTVQNNTMTDVATALTQSLAYDGQTLPIANLPMGTYRHTGVGNGVGRTDYAALGQQQDGKINWAVAGGTADALTATYSPVVTVLADGQLCFVRATATNATTTPTFSPNSLTERTVTKLGGAAVVAGEWVNLQELILRYNLANTRWELLNPRKVSASEIAGGTLGSVTIANSNTVTLKDTLFTVQDDGDATKLLAFQLSGIATGNTRTVTMPDKSGTMAMTSDIPTVPSAASQAEIEAAVVTDKYIPPGLLKYYPTTLSSMARIAVSGGTPALTNIKNCSAITDNGIGDLTVTFSEAYSSASLVVPFALVESTVTTVARTVSVRPGGIGTNSVRYICSDAAGSLVDPAAWFVGVAGDFA